MEAHVIEWLNLAIRWFHFITGVAWIGASFYFNWLENHLNRENQRPGIAGSLWAIHGGGFYFLEKYKVAPPEIPKTLHWFKWEAYFTWISGFTLLTVVYYFNAKLYLVDPSHPIASGTAIAISLGSLVGGWVIYDLLCKSPQGKDNRFIALIGFLLATAAAYGLSRVFNSRAAYLHVGAILGTCMAANVFHVIIPSQKALVSSALKGLAPDALLGKKAFQRSLHNNYMTLPVLFVMVSNHFPSTYSHHWNWLILAGLSLVGAGVRHWFNLKGRGQYNVWILPAAALGMVALAFVTAPRSNSVGAVGGAKIPFAQVATIIRERCTNCHSLKPTDSVFVVPPAGVMFDSPEQIHDWATRIKARAVDLENMPFANKTGMSKEERVTLGRWVDEGASLE